MRLAIKAKIPPTLFKATAKKIAAATQKGVREALLASRDTISKTAESKLKGKNLAEYQKGLHTPESIVQDGDHGSVNLIGDIATGLEKGFPTYSIAEKMLAKATKTNKDGAPYVDVPFEHKESELPPHVRNEMHAMVRQAKDEMVVVRRRISTKGMEIRKRLHPSGRIRVKHKRGIHDDLVRYPVKVKGKVKSRFVSFRRISNKSPKNAWVHPGFRGVHLFKSMREVLAKNAAKIIRDMIKRILRA